MISFAKLKTIQPHFEYVKRGIKTFELRFGDRNYFDGMILYLMEYHPYQGFTGEVCKVLVTHMIPSSYGEIYGLKPGYVCMSICLVSSFRVIMPSYWYESKAEEFE